VSDLNDFHAESVLAGGQVVAEKGRMLVEPPRVAYPDWAVRSVHLKRPLKAEDFKLSIPDVMRDEKRVACNVIGIIENQAPTRHLTFNLQPNGNEIDADIRRDLAKVALVERHRGTGTIQLGLVSGFGFDVPCAIASTVAHDSHQMIVVGTDRRDMASAANKLAEVGGGQVVVKEGQVIGLVELKIGGLMSTEQAETVARKANTVLEGFRACGCKLNNPNMQLSLLALVVIPELRLSDKGLVDVTHFTFLPVVEGPAQ